MGLFSDKPNLFKQFLEEKDHREYLDTKEEIEDNRIQAAQEIISDYSISKGIDIDNIFKSLEHKKEVITRLLIWTKLSHRKIAKILNVSSSTVHTLSLEKQKSSKE